MMRDDTESDMPAIRQILCPVDLSEISRRALHCALAIGREHDAHVLVLEAIDVGLPTVSGGPPLQPLSPEIRSGLEDDLDWFVAPALSETPRVDVRLVEGPVIAEIVREAAALPADLIVLGTHGRGGFERLALGSVTEKVLRKAPCPVLVVPPGDGPPQVPFRTIVAATDFSEASADAWADARLLAGRSGAHLSLVHVVEWPFGESSGPDPVTALRESIEAEARAQLRALAAGPTEDPAVVDTVVLRGKPSREIAAFAREHHADLIVMGASGRGALDLALLGSTTHKVLHRAPCPVLTVPRGRRPGEDGVASSGRAPDRR